VGEIAMVLIALLSFLIGALLALRWNVLVLLEAVGAALPLVALIGSARGDDAGSLALDMLITVTFIETGYIAKLVAYVLADAAGAAMRIAILGRGAERLTGLPEKARAGIAPRGTIP
jgi:hypothetical protein